MIFSSLEFLTIFLPIVFLVYVCISKLNCKLGNVILFLSSLIFYYVSAKNYIWILLCVILIAYLCGLVNSVYSSILIRRVVLGISLILDLCVLSYFKFFGSVILPIGISFYIFQAISYMVDTYKDNSVVIKNPIDIGLYISFFPQLVAGPIVRYSDIRCYLDQKYRKLDINNISKGIWRFSIGLCKKVLIADRLNGLVSLVYGVKDITQFSVLYTWLGAISFTLQIYYDFSGYSDMAIGLGQIFGFEFKENFNYPYIAKTIKDFWKRWHISLSSFFRDYVYIPLGGNRCNIYRWVFNILFVWLLVGLWHGRYWNYIIWGLCYGLILLFEHFVIDKIPQSKILRIIRQFLTIFFVIILWVIFKCNDLYIMDEYLRNMFGFNGNMLIDEAFIFQMKNYSVLLLISIIFVVPVKQFIDIKITNNKIYQSLELIGLLIGVLWSVFYIFNEGYNPFLYFVF